MSNSQSPTPTGTGNNEENGNNNNKEEPFHRENETKNMTGGVTHMQATLDPSFSAVSLLERRRLFQQAIRTALNAFVERRKKKTRFPPVKAAAKQGKKCSKGWHRLQKRFRGRFVTARRNRVLNGAIRSRSGQLRCKNCNYPLDQNLCKQVSTTVPMQLGAAAGETAGRATHQQEIEFGLSCDPAVASSNEMETEDDGNDENSDFSWTKFLASVPIPVPLPPLNLYQVFTRELEEPNAEDQGAPSPPPEPILPTPPPTPPPVEVQNDGNIIVDEYFGVIDIDMICSMPSPNVDININLDTNLEANVNTNLVINLDSEMDSDLESDDDSDVEIIAEIKEPQRNWCGSLVNLLEEYDVTNLSPEEIEQQKQLELEATRSRFGPLDLSEIQPYLTNYLEDMEKLLPKQVPVIDLTLEDIADTENETDTDDDEDADGEEEDNDSDEEEVQIVRVIDYSEYKQWIKRILRGAYD